MRRRDDDGEMKLVENFLTLVVMWISFWIAPSVSAETLVNDARVGFNARTYPIGAQIVGTVGSSLKLWGDPSFFKYGYARLAFNGGTSAVVNRFGFEAQVFPISILGFSAGYDWGFRNFRPKYINCTLYECEGRVDRKYLKANLVMAFGRVIFVGQAKYENLRAVGTAKPFFDENTLLIGRNFGERVMLYNPVLLYTIDDQWKVGATSIYVHAIDTGDFSHLYGPIVSWAKDTRFNVAGGMGLNRSPVVTTGWAAFLSLQYTLSPSLSITDMAYRNELQTEKAKSNVEAAGI